MKKFLGLFLIFSFLCACSSTSQVQKGPVTPKSFVTPWEYYQKTRPAHWTEEDGREVQKTAVHSTGEDTDSDKNHMVLIGVLVGVTVVGGTVAGILLTR